MEYYNIQFFSGLNPQPTEDAERRRKDIRELIMGVRKNPILKKEQQKSHPDDHNKK